jgi:hypothetical protein
MAIAATLIADSFYTSVPRVRTAVYVRLQDPKHRLLVEYAKAHELTLNEVIERLVDQLLFQVAAEFRAPPWLIEAIRAGYLPFDLPEESEVEGDQDHPSTEGRLLRAL